MFHKFCELYFPVYHGKFICGLQYTIILYTTYYFITMSGVGKNHRDAASVRATHPIPPSCGIYYFEVKIISKGRDG